MNTNGHYTVGRTNCSGYSAAISCKHCPFFVTRSGVRRSSTSGMGTYNLPRGG